MPSISFRLQYEELENSSLDKMRKGYLKAKRQRAMQKAA